MLADSLPALASVLGPVEQDVGDGVALLTAGAAAAHRRVPYDAFGRQLSDCLKGDIRPFAHCAFSVRGLLACRLLASTELALQIKSYQTRVNAVHVKVRVSRLLHGYRQMAASWRNPGDLPSTGRTWPS